MKHKSYSHGWNVWFISFYDEEWDSVEHNVETRLFLWFNVLNGLRICAAFIDVDEVSTLRRQMVGTTWNSGRVRFGIFYHIQSIDSGVRSWWLIPRRLGFWGRFLVSSCMLVGGCRDRFLMRTLYCTLDRRRFGLRMIKMLLVLSASCVFPLRLHASLPRTYNWLFSMMSASCLGLRPPAAMTDGWFPPVQAVSSADLCNAFLEHHGRALSLGVRWKKIALGMHTSSILVTWPAQRSCTWNKMNSMLGRLALLRISSFDM